MILRKIDKTTHQIEPGPKPTVASPAGCQTLAGGRGASQDPRFTKMMSPTPAGSQHDRFCSIAHNPRHNPIGVETDWARITQGSSSLATLGWMTQSRRDWPDGPKPGLPTLNCAPDSWSLQTSAQFVWIPGGVPDRGDDNLRSFPLDG